MDQGATDEDHRLAPIIGGRTPRLIKWREKGSNLTECTDNNVVEIAKGQVKKNDKKPCFREFG